MAKQPSKPAKRRVKNPETFRERALKASDESTKSKRTSRVKSVFSKIFAPIGFILRPLGRGAKKAWSAAPLKWLHRPARLLGKVVFPAYFRQSWRELKQVDWPSWQESRRLTFAVLLFAIVFGALIAGVDYGLDKVFRNILLK